MENEKMTQEDGGDPNDHAALSWAPRQWVITAFVVVFAAVAIYLAAKLFFPGGAPFHEIHVGASVLRVPIPGTAQRKAVVLGDLDAAAQATFTILAKNNDEIKYTIASVNDDILTAEQFSELTAGIRREFSRVSQMLREARIQGDILHRTGIRLDRVEFKQYEENGALVRMVKGYTVNDYRQKVYIESALILFLFQGRPYTVMVITASLSPSFADPLKEVWKWHGEIIAANFDDA